jgi:Na+-translocating ferredoxin:NAD+ oxidoreductase subunit B
MALLGTAVLAILTGALGGALGWMAARMRPTGPKLIDAIDLLLPQTQCERCGHPGCRPYAEAVAAGAAINRCPPGGHATIDALAALLNRPAVALDPDLAPMDASAVALIDESRCIGCALCLPACPVDAISGAAGHMHTVIARHCTGCELCIPACPVDCIAMIADASRATASALQSAAETDRERADDSRRRYDAHRKRAAAREFAAEERRQERQARLSSRRSWDDQ